MMNNMDKSPRISKRKHFCLKRLQQYAAIYWQPSPSSSPYRGAGSSFSISTSKCSSRLSNRVSNNDTAQQQYEAQGILSKQKVICNHPFLIKFQYTDEDIGGIQVTKMSKSSSSNENGNNEAKKPLTTTTTNSKPKIQPKYDVHRDVLTHELVIKQTGYNARDKSIPYGLKKCWHNWSFWAMFAGILPIVQWLPKYSPKRDLIGDIIAGFTVAIMHIPHGMAYGLLAGVSPGCGLYMAIFPTLVYMVLGTSKHISIGTFAVASMMTLKVVQSYASDEQVISQGGENVITPLEVVTTLAFTVGLLHLAMGFFRLGTLSSLLSDPLVNGFTTGAACHVVTSQLKDVFGVTVPRHKGAFKIIYTIVDLCAALPSTNVPALLFCLGIIVFMTICNELIKPCLRKYCRFPLPAELIAVIGGTVISMLVDVKNKYDIKPVGDIPTGLPMPVLPRMDLVPDLVVDSIAIAIVTYSIVMSLGLTFAKKHSYEVRPNQELFAMGVGNIVGGFFQCIPLACSLSRSLIQEQTGGATQLASLVSALIILITLFWAGPFFSFLPRCVLAGVIIVALKPMFMQAGELKKFSKQGKLELLTWLSTFICVVLIDIDIGLLIGVCISLLSLYIKGLKPYSCLLGYIPEASAVYVDMNHHRNAFEVPETKIFRYCGSLNFATSMYFRKALNKALGIDSENTRRASYIPLSQNGSTTINGGITPLHHLNSSFRYLILDFSMLGHIDVAGSRALSDVKHELEKRGVCTFFATPTDRVYDCLVHSMVLGEGPFEMFPTLHDAVEYANACRLA
ncbi:solute carrier family 26 member 6 isoform X2 [Stomoxys calcitrans]|uniref:solute carrier family 26 member 6 isoform X2 n=1 Tax=Stomoxys calcitrans TaxID=35570 RepID=UPI0027E33CC5|nr:solute carrier family 26 member 6 isoform X2 [Stomoxys calcitrans]